MIDVLRVYAYLCGFLDDTSLVGLCIGCDFRSDEVIAAFCLHRVWSTTEDWLFNPMYVMCKEAIVEIWQVVCLT